MPPTTVKPFPPALADTVYAFNTSRQLLAQLAFRRPDYAMNRRPDYDPMVRTTRPDRLDAAARSARGIVAALREQLLSEASTMLFEGTGVRVISTAHDLHGSIDGARWSCACGDRSAGVAVADRAVADAVAHAAVAHAETHTPGCETDPTAWGLMWLAQTARAEHIRELARRRNDLVARGDATDRALEEIRAEMRATYVEIELRRVHGSGWALRFGR